MNNKADKPKQSSHALVYKMRDEKGIRFDLMNEEAAEKYLLDINNYLRTASYRVNYPKHSNGINQGKYINLDFEYLRELSAIDLQVRHAALQMCLDVEHGLKVKILKAIETDHDEDGYSIVKDFLDKNQHMLKGIAGTSGSPFTKDLMYNYLTFQDVAIPNAPGKTRRIITGYDECPVWVLFEFITFGDFVQFYEFYCKRKQLKGLSIQTLNTVKSLRNGCAHNNCILANLKAGRTSPSTEITKKVSTLNNITSSQAKKKLSVRPLFELACLLHAYKYAMSDNDDRKSLNSLAVVLYERAMLHKDYYESNETIASAHSFAIKLLEGVFPEEYPCSVANKQNHNKNTGNPILKALKKMLFRP